ncbi:hypothetical protein FRB90_008107 [Tulasnella sp. 427]|nr:hypothetical protein FRB90_008107 [Tulasnella sp. 427]
MATTNDSSNDSVLRVGGISIDDIFKFTAIFPSTPKSPFRTPDPSKPYMAADPTTKPQSYFHAYSPGMQENIPIPGHPQLVDGPFYSTMAYLFDVSSRYQAPSPLENLTEESLEECLHSGTSDLPAQMRSILGTGKSVVVNGCTNYLNPSEINISNPKFSATVGFPERAIFVQDLLQWPRVTSTTVSKYEELMDDPRALLNILELNGYARLNRPPWISGLFEDARLLGWDRSTAPFSHSDNLRTHSWMLWGHPFSYTLLHHDTLGFSTFVTVSKGVKLWFVLEWTVRPTASDWFRRYSNLAMDLIWCLEYRARPPWVIEKDGRFFFDSELFTQQSPSWEEHRVARWVVVTLRVGTTLIMSPATPHVVYNVTEAFTIGGHGLFWEGFPLTEVSCRMDNLDDSISNDIHGASIHSFTQFALSLPDITAATELPERPSRREIESLARILLRPENYRQVQPSGADPDIRYHPYEQPEARSRAVTKIRRYADILNLVLPPSRSAADPQEDDFSWAPTELYF